MSRIADIKGKPVFTIGHPFGAFSKYSSGVVKSQNKNEVYIDIDTNTGNSGGPVISQQGEVLGFFSGGPPLNYRLFENKNCYGFTGFAPTGPNYNKFHAVSEASVIEKMMPEVDLMIEKVEIFYGNKRVSASNSKLGVLYGKIQRGKKYQIRIKARISGLKKPESFILRQGKSPLMIKYDETHKAFVTPRKPEFSYEGTFEVAAPCSAFAQPNPKLARYVLEYQGIGIKKFKELRLPCPEDTNIPPDFSPVGIGGIDTGKSTVVTTEYSSCMSGGQCLCEVVSKGSSFFPQESDLMLSGQANAAIYMFVGE